MKILACSYCFAPSVGGIETVTQLLAGEWTSMDHEVVVITQTPILSENTELSFPFRVVRQPGKRALSEWIRWADVVWCNNISLRYALPAMLSGANLVVTTQTWLDKSNLRNHITSLIKQSLLRRCRNIAISKAVAATLPPESVVIGNPFDASQFKFPSATIRTHDLLFVGRLVDDKGAATLLEALALLAAAGLHPKLTLAGGGPERPRLEAQAHQAGIQDQVQFAGIRQNSELAALYHSHRILVVPSLWAEPLGIVALEGLAAGCRLVVSDTGGLPEAAGPQALHFPAGNAPALAEKLKDALKSTATPDFEANRQHLSRYLPRHVAERYLELFSLKNSPDCAKSGLSCFL